MLHAISIALLSGGADEELESDSSPLSFILQIPKTSLLKGGLRSHGKLTPDYYEHQAENYK